MAGTSYSSGGGGGVGDSLVSLEADFCGTVKVGKWRGKGANL